MVDSCYVGGKFKGINILDLENNEDRKILNTKLQDYLDLRSRSVLSSGSLGQVKVLLQTQKILFLLFHL